MERGVKEQAYMQGDREARGLENKQGVVLSCPTYVETCVTAGQVGSSEYGWKDGAYECISLVYVQETERAVRILHYTEVQ